VTTRYSDVGSSRETSPRPLRSTSSRIFRNCRGSCARVASLILAASVRANLPRNCISPPREEKTRTPPLRRTGCRGKRPSPVPLIWNSSESSSEAASSESEDSRKDENRSKIEGTLSRGERGSLSLSLSLSRSLSREIRSFLRATQCARRDCGRLFC